MTHPKPEKRIIPTGNCWCGCGTEVGLGSFFAPGHDRRAANAVIKKEYGSVVDFLVAHGYGPGGKCPDCDDEEC